MWSGSRAGTKDKKGVHGVGLAVKAERWGSVEKEDRTVECNSPRLMKVWLQMGRTCGVIFVVGFAPTETALRGSVGTSDKDKDLFWSTLHEVIREVPGRDHVVCSSWMRTRALARCVSDAKIPDTNVMGAYWRDDLNGNGMRLLGFLRQSTDCV